MLLVTSHDISFRYEKYLAIYFCATRNSHNNIILLLWEISHNIAMAVHVLMCVYVVLLFGAWWLLGSVRLRGRGRRVVGVGVLGVVRPNMGDSSLMPSPVIDTLSSRCSQSCLLQILHSNAGLMEFLNFCNRKIYWFCTELHS